MRKSLLIFILAGALLLTGCQEASVARQLEGLSELVEQIGPLPTVTPTPAPTPSPKPTATPAPTATPHPGKGEPPKTGDESKILVYGLLATSSALAALGLFVYLNKKEEENNANKNYDNTKYDSTNFGKQ